MSHNARSTTQIAQRSTQPTLISAYEAIIKDIAQDWREIMETAGIREVLEKIPLARCTPPPAVMLNFARRTPISSIRVVIIGQDPYPKAGDADGLAFSSESKTCPGSLRNIFAALINAGILTKQPTSYSLLRWAEQGVLLLNSAWTTSFGKSNEHQTLWHPVVEKVVAQIAAKQNPIFLLWGREAQKFADHIGQAPSMQYIHPSPMNGTKFHDCPHFLEVNKTLRPPINWDPESTDVLDIQPATAQPAIVARPVRPKCSDPKTPEEYFSLHSDKIVIFTDGSCYPNKLCKEARGGYAAYWAAGKLGGKCLYGSVAIDKQFASNQRAEGLAIYMAMLEVQKDSALSKDKIVDLEIVTDSEFWVTMFEIYMPTWVRENVDFKSKKNSDLTILMWKLRETMMAAGHEIRFRHMRAHNALQWSTYAPGTYQLFCFKMNDYVDRLATHARTTMTPGTHTITRVAHK